ncbi:MAG: glutamate-1-semialdehyde 2,1-aminomutase [Alphaproteobacteria bacterium]|nr:glutamate-1-semialdehyde 2,1-aminomutase [Alphaproteobacteria bacterium]
MTNLNLSNNAFPNEIDDSSETHRLIPGGAHTYSKGDDQFPYVAPRYLEKGDGATVWDRHGQSFIDWTMGLRSVLLGHNFAPVSEAAIAQIGRGTNFGRPSYIETELAAELVELIPCAEMVKFSKDGSTTTTAAIKLARAFTSRRYVAYCSDNPFFSYDDWFIGTTACNAGVPQEHSDLSLPFSFNDIESLEAQFAAHPNDIAAVILEPCMSEAPKDDFLKKVRALCDREGACMILDEMITGFRWHLSGAQKMYDVTPDLATFGKGMANGFSVSALVGRREIMELGGINHDKLRVFLISTTHGAENHGLAAALASIQFFKANPVVDHIWNIGQQLIDGMNIAAKELGVANSFSAGGFPCRPEYKCLDKDGVPSAGLRTLFLQELVREGVLLNYITPSWSHGDAELNATIEAVRKALVIYAQGLEDGWKNLLIGDPVKPVFRAFN